MDEFEPNSINKTLCFIQLAVMDCVSKKHSLLGTAVQPLPAVVQSKVGEAV